MSILYGDKIFKQSLLNICFPTVKTYIQSESYSVGGMTYASTTPHAVEGWLDWSLLQGFPYELLCL